MSRIHAGAALALLLGLLSSAALGSGSAPLEAQPTPVEGQPAPLEAQQDRSLSAEDALTLRILPADAPPAGLGPEARNPADVPRGGWRAPHVLRDASLLFGGTAAYAMARSKHRGFILGGGSVSNVLENFRDPIGRALSTDDRDAFLTNYVSHPVTWGGIALYLKYQGYSDAGAFALSQAHSVFWEYVVEGSYATPSGRDMVTNFFSAAAVVYVLPLVTGELFPSAGGDVPADGGGEGDGLTLHLAPPIDRGPAGPRLQLGLEIR